MGRRAPDFFVKFKVFFALICSIPMLAGPVFAKSEVVETQTSPAFPREIPRERSVYYPNSNYPAGKVSKESLPANRSLTIIPGEEVRSHSPRGSGASELTNSYPDRYRLSESAGFRPSKVTAEYLGLKAEQLGWIRTEVAKLVRGQPNGLVQSGAIKDKASGVGNFGINLAQGAAAFGVAMGMIAAVQLKINYPTNPAAWTSYIQSTASAEGLIQLTAFMAVAGGSYWAGQKMTRKMFGEQALNKTGARTALYGGSLAAAVVAGTILSEMMADPNTAKCTGLTNYRENGAFKMDMAACDALWDTWQSNAHWNKMATEQIMPMFANIMVAGGMVKAAEMGLSWVITRPVVFNFVQRIGFSFSSVNGGGPAVKLIGKLAPVVLFVGAYTISDEVFGVGQWTREFFLADWSFSNDPLGNSLTQVETNLLKEWSRLKNNDFKNQEPRSQVRSRVYQPPVLEFSALLNKYSKGREEWRKIQMTATDAAAQQWRLKSDEYFSMLEVASDFYREAVKRLAYERQISDPKLKEEFGFNQKFVEDFVKSQNGKAQAAWESLKKKNFDGEWKYLATYKLADYLVASMACGPEVEGYGIGEKGLWGKMQGLWTDWASGNTTPAKMVEDNRGFSMSFHPPRLVKPLDSAQTSICQQGGVSSLFSLSPVRVPPGSYPSKTEDGRYASLFDYIRAELRPGIIEGNESRLESWWKRYVGSQAEKVEQGLRRDYEGLLNNEYRQALINKSYRSCAFSEVRLPVLEDILLGLRTSEDSCSPDQTHRLGRGILNSLRDEMRFYMALQTDLYLSNMGRLGSMNPEFADEARTEMLERQQNMLTIMEALLDGATEVDPKNRPDITKFAEMFDKLSMKQKMSLLTPQPEGWTKGQPLPENPYSYLEYWAFQLSQKIDGTFIQALSLYKILANFESK